MLRAPLKDQQNIPPPSSFLGAPLTPPPTCKKAFTQASRVIALFKDIEAGRHAGQHPWTEFQLARGEYDEIERQLRQDEWLFGFVKDKIRCAASKQIEVPANDGNRTDMTTMEGRTKLLFACRPVYMSSLLVVLRMQFEVS
jgi:hypothetical protein